MCWQCLQTWPVWPFGEPAAPAFRPQDGPQPRTERPQPASPEASMSSSRLKTCRSSIGAPSTRQNLCDELLAPTASQGRRSSFLASLPPNEQLPVINIRRSEPRRKPVMSKTSPPSSLTLVLSKLRGVVVAVKRSERRSFSRSTTFTSRPSIVRSIVIWRAAHSAVSTPLLVTVQDSILSCAAPATGATRARITKTVLNRTKIRLSETGTRPAARFAAPEGNGIVIP
jgi:hypothetical protein